jgi:Thiamine pyrophosphate enzyme, C-terminal TPP binding domain
MGGKRADTLLRAGTSPNGQRPVLAARERPSSGLVGPADLLAEHQPGDSTSIGRAGVQDVQMGDHHVARRSCQLDDLDRHAVDLAPRPDQRPAMVWQVGSARFEIEMQWGSIGWAVPATFGYAKGLEPDRRLVSVIGDGSFQLTAQEVANMIRRQEILIFVVNNRGHVVESAIHDSPCNYFKNWDYAGLIDAFNAEDGHGLGLKATTGKELADAISSARKHKGGPVLIECQIAHDDSSTQLLE